MLSMKGKYWLLFQIKSPPTLTMSTTWTGWVSMFQTRKSLTMLDCQPSKSAESSPARTQLYLIPDYILIVQSPYLDDMFMSKQQVSPTDGGNFSMSFSVKWWCIKEKLETWTIKKWSFSTLRTMQPYMFKVT